MNKEFKKKMDYVLKRYPKADERHLYKMLGKLINGGNANVRRKSRV